MGVLVYRVAGGPGLFWTIPKETCRANHVQWIVAGAPGGGGRVLSHLRAVVRVDQARRRPPDYGEAVYDAGRQRVLFVGYGWVGQPAVLRVWSWDGAGWTLLSSNGPTKRWSPGVAYDAAHDRVVLFGGHNGTSLFAETWEWDGATWTQRFPAAGPPARWDAGMVYHAARQRTVLFGGNPVPDPGSYLGDTWEWDGSTWTQAAASGPSPRLVSAMAYDSLRARTVLYGGYGPAAGFADLWEWDGTAWLERPNSLSGSAALWMVFDPGRGRMIMGRYGQVPPETWELNTATAEWTIREHNVCPLGPAAFDVARARAVVAGAFGSPHRTMEYNGFATIVSPYIITQPTGGVYDPGDVVALTGAAGGTQVQFQWRRDGLELVDDGRISGARTAMLTINHALISDSGSYDVVAANDCGTEASAQVGVRVGPPPCYANCDGSTIAPVLNVNDFVCFLNRWHAQDLYADCDHSSSPPILSVLDFICFQTIYSHGCP
jgi:immunoglobulin I-set domain protein